jgi:hypothetical protein
VLPIKKRILQNATSQNDVISGVAKGTGYTRSSALRRTRKTINRDMNHRTHRAIRALRPRATSLAALVAVASMALSGCSSLYTESATAGAGIGGAALAAKVTSNAAVATGIGLGVVAAAKAGVQYSQRVVHRDTQDHIAMAAGPLEVGAVTPWSVTHRIPIEDDEHGRVTVSRTISTGPLACKEIVFSVDQAATPNVPASSAFYVASICRDGQAWKWASAEPATERWGALQ